MAYADPQPHSCKKLASLGGVALVHIALGFGLAAGLAVNIVATEDDEKLTLLPIDDEIPPPPDDPPPDAPNPDPIEPSYNPPVVPSPPLDLAPISPVEVTTDLLPPTPPVLTIPTPRPPAPPPPPAPRYEARDPAPSNGPLGWITNADYPLRALTREQEGTAIYAVEVGADGKPDDCRIVSSTGHRALDDATCRFVERRARFDPAMDSQGRTVAGTYRGTVTWEIPED